MQINIPQADNLGQPNNGVHVMSAAPDLMVVQDVHRLLKHLDVYLTPTFINGKPTKGNAIRVFEGFEEPELEKRQEDGKEVLFYKEFDEKKGYKEKIKKVDDFNQAEYEQENMRKFQKNDGLGYVYSKHKRIPVKVQNKEQKSEAIQMLICITMYGEPKDFLINTLRGIHANLKHFQKMGISSKQIVVVIFQDGIMKMKEEMVEYFSELDILQGRDLALVRRRQIIQQQIDFLKREKKQSVLDYNDGLPNTIPKKIALLYQDFIKFQGQEGELPTFSVFKHLNAKKLSSHLWFFEGFCRQFQPKYCALVDVGTIPDQYGLVNMFKALEADDNIGGVCGFMGLKSPKENESTEEFKQNYEAKREELEKQLKEQHSWIQEDQQKSEEQKKANQEQLTQQQELEKKKRDSNVVQIKQTSKREKQVDRNLMIGCNVFFIIGLIFSLIYQAFLWIINKIFLLITIILRFFFGLASLPQAQNYEYTTAHMIDKNFESCLGFLHVLPGAWSAYRYKALNITKENRENIIQKRYLKQILNQKLLKNTIQELNMFLAEDRILCLGIFCQVEQNYKLKFIPDAKAFTDPVDTFEDFLNQRRRWINSSWFALNYVLQNYEYHIEESGHSFIMKYFILPFNMLFAQIGKFNTFFIPAFYLFVAILCSFQFLKPTTTLSYKLISTETEFKDNTSISCKQNDETNLNICSNTFTNPCYIECSNYQVPNIFFTFLNFIPAIFVVLIIMILFASLTFKPKVVNISPEEERKLKEIQRIESKGRELDSQQKKEKKDIQNKYSQKFQNDVFKILASLISLISCAIVLIVTATIILNLIDSSYVLSIEVQELSRGFKIYMLVMIGLNYGSFFVSLFFHLLFQPFIAWNILISFMSYWIYSPVYNHILLIFSFCNIDDVTWGTKGLTDSKQNEKQKNEKIEFVGNWILWNVFVLTALLTANSISSNTPYVIMILGGFGTVYSFIKTFLGLLHYIKYFLFDKLFNFCKLSKKKPVYFSTTQIIDNFFGQIRLDQIKSSYHPVGSIEKSFDSSFQQQVDLNDSMNQFDDLNLERGETQNNLINPSQQFSQQLIENLTGQQFNNNNNNIGLAPIQEMDDNNKEMEIPTSKVSKHKNQKEINIEMNQFKQKNFGHEEFLETNNLMIMEGDIKVQSLPQSISKLHKK